MEDNSLSVKKMPISIEAEQAFLGSIIRKPDAFDAVGGMLTAEDFYLTVILFFKRGNIGNIFFGIFLCHSIAIVKKSIAVP